jgi:raffinose/stachyose/melibiose transport system substrate-binding protein
MEEDMKKKLIPVLALVCCGALLAVLGGCKKKDDASGITKAVLWHQSVGETDPSGPILKRLVAEWNELNPEFQVEEDGVTGELYKTKIKTALSGGSAPDFMYMYAGSFVAPFIENGSFLEIGSRIPQSTKARVLPASYAKIDRAGKLYTLPNYTHIASLYCNKELFDRAGAKLPTTYTELLEAAKKLRAAGITPAALGEKDRWPGMYWFDIIAMRQAGIPACLEAMKNPALFNAPDFIEAARKVQELVDAGFFNSSMFSMSFDEMLGAFNNGQSAMLYQGNWVNAGIEASAATKGKVTVITFPLFEGGKGATTEFYGGSDDSAYYVNAKVKNPDKAAEFVAFFSENLGKQGYLAGAGLPCWDTAGLDTSALSGLDKEVAVSTSVAKSFIPWWDNILPADSSEIHKDLIAELLAKAITPEEFCRRMSQIRPSEL